MNYIIEVNFILASMFLFKALGKQLKPYLDKGALVPDNLSCSLIISAVSDLEKGRNSWLLDGINFYIHFYFLL